MDYLAALATIEILALGPLLGVVSLRRTGRVPKHVEIPDAFSGN